MIKQPSGITAAIALRAIIARINGVYDNPYLERFGILSTDTLQDVWEIAEAWEETGDDFIESDTLNTNNE